MSQILVCSAQERAIRIIHESIKKSDRMGSVRSLDECRSQLNRARFDFLFIDTDFFEPAENIKNSREQLDPLWINNPALEIILLTTKENIRRTVHLVKAGASDYLTFPLDPVEIHHVIDSIVQDQQIYSEVKYLRDQFWHRDSYAILKTNSPKMRDVFEKVRAVAPMESTVLLLGETGTGKGVIANLIHRHSPRRERQFIQIHCGAISDSILESEMFGHEKGAFTGATRRKLGKFEIANGGTLFLDEIGTISPNMQVNLLQVLQNRCFQRVGGEQDIHVDVRLIAATNADLQQLSQEGLFRQDLYFRLNVFPIVIPPLRQRKEDIPMLVQTFLDAMNQNSAKKVRQTDPAVLKALNQYHWPGNIRELENVIERAFVLARSGRLTLDCLPAELINPSEMASIFSVNAGMTLDEARKHTLDLMEKAYLTQLLTEHGGRIARSAESAGIGVRQLHKLLTRHQIKKSQFKHPDSSAGHSEL
ncbi:sigma-54-dependent Fis family transcriptional regulator [bacterium]|nr:sigma-54-dependent Fis family transcriptional regulator [bacterium]